MTRRKLPIGMQTFRDIRESNCYYVDKTAYVGRLLDEGKHYFLSRPRRFGKSLFLDTCKELFEGNEPLFEGLAIHDRWDWSVRHPVLRLSFGSGNFKEPGYLNISLMAQLDDLEEQLGVSSRYDTAAERFGHLVKLPLTRVRKLKRDFANRQLIDDPPGKGLFLSFVYSRRALPTMPARTTDPIRGRAAAAIKAG